MKALLLRDAAQPRGDRRLRRRRVVFEQRDLVQEAPILERADQSIVNNHQILRCGRNDESRTEKQEPTSSQNAFG